MKKIINMSIAAAILLQSVGLHGFAADGDSVTISGGRTLRTRSLLTAALNPENGDFSLQWIASDEENGTYFPILGATDTTYKLSTLDAGKYIGLEATNNNDGEKVISDVKRTLDTLGPVSKTNYTSTDTSKAGTTPSENLFYVGDKGFILLREFQNDSSKYYILAENFYGDIAFDSNSYANFDPLAEGNIGYFLNNTFLTEGNDGEKLPDSIINHIDKNHIWWTEKGRTGGDSGEDYSSVAGVSLLSASEADVFYGFYGWKASGVSEDWWLRTQQGSSSTIDDNIFVMSNGNTKEELCTSSKMLRPAFYLDKDFFATVKIDTAKTGKNIAEMMKKNYSETELLQLYTTDELIKMGIREKEFSLNMKSETTQLGTKLIAEFQNISNQELSDVKYQWVCKYDNDESYSAIYKENNSEYLVSVEDMDRTITVIATPIAKDGISLTPVTAEESYTVSGFGKQNRTNYEADIRTATKTTPAENLFTVSGQQFILLNEYQDDNSAFLIMTEGTYGQKEYDPDLTEKFDVSDENNIGYFLNNEFLSEGNGDKQLPEKIISHIDKNHTWWTEAGGPNGQCPEDYSFTAGLTLMSKSEFVKYYGRFGWSIGITGDDKWWGRTARAVSGADGAILSCDQTTGAGGDLWGANSTVLNYIRPIFCLDRNFFADVKISEAGENVIAAIRRCYSISELINGNAGYSMQELEKLGVVVYPEVKNLKISGNETVNGTLFGNYLYSSEKDEGESQFGFEASLDNVNYSVVKNNTSSYEITSADTGKFIRFYCIPKDTDGIEGAKQVSRAIKVAGNQKISVNNLQYDSNAVSSAKPITPRFELVNKADSAQQAVCIIALYDVNDKLIASQMQIYNVSANETVISDNLSLSPVVQGASYAKIILVDGLKTMNSLLGYEVVIK